MILQQRGMMNLFKKMCDAPDMYYGILTDRVGFFKESKDGIEIMWFRYTN